MKLAISTKADLDLDDIYHYLMENFSEKIADEKLGKLYKDIYILAKALHIYYIICSPFMP